MSPIRPILSIVLITAWSSASAETMKFEDDPARLKDCLLRNQDSLSPQCRTDYVRAFDAIQKRVAARSAVAKICERDAVKLCGGIPKEGGQALECILTATRGVSARCNQAIGEAGYR